MRVITRLASAAVIAAVPMVLLAGVASAADHTITVDPNPVTPGSKLTFSGSGCISTDPSFPAEVIVLADDTVVPVVLQPDGTWSVTVGVDPTAEPATHTIDATCDEYTTFFDYTPATVKVIAGKATNNAGTKVASGADIGSVKTAKATTSAKAATVASGTVTAAAPVLASTGVNTLGMTAVGLGLAAAGAGALVAGRRRTQGEQG